MLLVESIVGSIARLSTIFEKYPKRFPSVNLFAADKHTRTYRYTKQLEGHHKKILPCCIVSVPFKYWTMMRSCFFASLVPVLLLVLVKNSSAFVSPSSTRKIISTVTIATLHALPSPEESAKALSDYMAKAHEEKLKAIKDAEAKKQTEIEVSHQSH